MTYKATTPGLDRMRKLIKGLGGKYRADPALGTVNAAKLSYLRATGRDFMRSTPAMTSAVARYMQAELARNPNASVPSMLKAAANAMQAHVALRFSYGGNDVTLAPLTAQYLARKIMRGLDPRVGIATRALVNELTRSTWRIAR